MFERVLNTPALQEIAHKIVYFRRSGLQMFYKRIYKKKVRLKISKIHRKTAVAETFI